MAKMNLCIDVGNTSTKAALFKNNKEVRYFKPFTAKDLKEIIADENPNILASFSGENLEIKLELKSHQILTHKTLLPICLNYETPNTLGRDRIATAVGAYAMDKKSTWAIIDLGTCLTFDLLNKADFEGGLIAPGVQIRLKAMNEFTAGLPLVKYDYSVKFPGKSTEESLQVGVCQSVMLEIKGYINLLNQQFKNVKIVDCSGLKLNFDKEVKNEIFARPKLVLEGLNYILNYNAK